MIHTSEWLRRLRILLFRREFHRDLKEELQLHLDLRTKQHIESGLAPDVARRAAHLKFGDATRIQEQSSLATGAFALDSLRSDVHYAIRQLLKSPGFVLTVILTLALGIGANLAVFQLLYGVLFAHLPVRHPEQLYSLHAVESPFDGQFFVSYPAYERLRQATPNNAERSAQLFARSGIGGGVLEESDGSTTGADCQLISDNFFNALGVSPAAGRFFAPGDDSRQQSEWPVILRYGFAKHHFAVNGVSSLASIIGKRATYNAIPIVIIGIAPDGFNGVLQSMAPDLWFPLAAQGTGQLGTWFDSLGPGYGLDLDKPYVNQPQIFWLWVLARAPADIKPALTARWTAALAPDIAMLAAATKDAPRRAHVLAANVKLVSAANGEGSLSRTYTEPLLILMAMAAVILLVGCLNLANLQMARLEQREKEIDIRIALGASRSRVLRQVAIEAVLLAAIGGIFALITGVLSSSLLLHWASRRDFTIPLDLHIGIAAAALGTALLSASLLGFGLLPAWIATRKSFSHAMRSRTTSTSGQTKSSRLWSNILLACQVSFSLLLLSAAALFTQTLQNVMRIDTGMDRDHILTVHLDMNSTGYAKHQTNFPPLYNAVTERLSALPGVRSAAVQMCDIPHCGWATAFHVFGNPNLPEEQLHGEENHIGLNYFNTLGIPVLKGRDFTSTDTPKTTKGAILSLSYARKLFGDKDPIGHWIGYNSAPDDHQFQVIGVVADARVDGLRQDAPPVAYISLEQNPQKFGTIELRVNGPVGELNSLPTEIRSTLHSIDPAMPITEIVPLSLEFNDDLTTEKLLAKLTTVFGGLTLAMAALGFYGLLSFRVARRKSEIGIRMALGATRNQVQSLFLNQTLTIFALGLIPGASLSVLLHHLARKLVYEQPSLTSHTYIDLWPLCFAIGVLACVAILATLLPARRAASIDPAQTLRAE